MLVWLLSLIDITKILSIETMTMCAVTLVYESTFFPMLLQILLLLFQTLYLFILFMILLYCISIWCSMEVVIVGIFYFLNFEEIIKLIVNQILSLLLSWWKINTTIWKWNMNMKYYYMKSIPLYHYKAKNISSNRSTVTYITIPLVFFFY